MKKLLRIALLHAAIAYRKVDENRQLLLDLITQAVEDGARLIVAPEMALPGYSFEGRDDIASLVETVDGHTVTAVCAEKTVLPRGCFFYPHSPTRTGPSMKFQVSCVVGP